MRNGLVTALVVAVTAGTASAQVGALSASDTNAPPSNPAMTNEVTSFGSLTNSVVAGPGVDAPGALGLDPRMDEPFVLSSQLWQSDEMAVSGGGGRPFADPDGMQVQRDALFRNLDRLVRAEVHSSPIYFGVDSEVKFVERHDYQPGIPAPVGISYRGGQQRFSFFAELAPILEITPSTSLEWGGGLGVRFFFNH
ncbi:MAG: hypothetical protein NT154_47780 [Verrucomicrobia bacterium]|nr:hypothetical protein [Verrucomicrobiota bacterium]